MQDKQGRYPPYMTFGSILASLGLVGACFGFFLKYNDRLLIVEAAQTASDQRAQQTQREILQRLQDLQTDVRELRSENGVRWRELPPSPFKRR